MIGTLFQKNRRLTAGLAVLALIAVSYLWFGRTADEATRATFTAQRGPLRVTVLEGGSVGPKQALIVRSEVRNREGAKILSIVEEGYLITEEDVRDGKILVELDSSEIEERIVQEDIEFQNALADYVNAQQELTIQVNQNRSDVKLAEQRAKFALMDMQKYLGDIATKEILIKIGLPTDISTNSVDTTESELAGIELTMSLATNQPTMTPRNGRSANDRAVGFPGGEAWAGVMQGSASPALPPTDSLPQLESLSASSVPLSMSSLTFDFSEYLDEAKLGDGAAKQTLRKLEDDLLVAQTDLNVAKTKLEGTQRLFAKDFVTKTELDNDEIAVKKNELRVETARTALLLFEKYEFAKLAEESLSTYEEALQSLERTRKEAVSRLAQRRARFRSEERQYLIQQSEIKEWYEQLEKCSIRAPGPGLVVYGGTDNRRYYNVEEQIREGATVRERQPIITIPDTTQMNVAVKIPESQIKKIQKGMKARITVEAYTDEILTGEVSKVGVLPDSQDRYLNPDLKEYATTVTIDGTREWLKPGMTAEVEILVRDYRDVVYVPLQAVIPVGSKYFCYVGEGANVEKREVTVGDFNDEFIVIHDGLRPGEIVQLTSPEDPFIDAQPGSKEGFPEPLAAPANGLAATNS